MNHFKIILLTGLVLTAGLCGTLRAEVAMEEIKVDDIWVKAMPPSAEYSAAFLTITNTSEKDVTLVKVKSDVCETVEIHQMETVDGVMTMRQTKRLVIPKGETVALAPGGTHIMLIDLIEPLTEGGTVDLVLVFSNGMERPVSAVIKKEIFSDDGQDDDADDNDDSGDEGDDEAVHEGHHHGRH